MSREIIKTVQYKINEDGDCRQCKSYKDRNCLAFSGRSLLLYGQLEACKNFLAEEKAKIKCKGCKHTDYANGMFGGIKTCKLGHEVTESVLDGTYSLNCQDRSE